MLSRVDALFISFEFIPYLTALLHSFGVGAIFLLLDLVNVLSGKEKISRKWFFRDYAVFTILLLWVNIEISRLLSVNCGEEAFLFKLLHLILKSALIGL
jgi:hypothetical protein